MALSAMRDFLARHIMRRIDVYQIDDFNMDAPEIIRLKQRVDTHSVKPEVQINVTRPFDFDQEIPCKTTRLNFAANETVKTRKHKIKKYTKKDVKTHNISFNKKIRTWKLLKQIQALPQERKNLLKLQKKRINVASNEMILAWYWPIVDKAVLKLALNKQRGTLLVWYTPGSRHNKARGVYLIRRLGLGEKPEWRWV